MRNFQRKRRWRNIVESWPVLILLGMVLLFFTWGVFGLMRKMQATGENRDIAANKIAELQKEKEQLSSEIHSLGTDQGKEAFFRQTLGEAKEGEGLIIVVEDKNAPKAEASSSSGFLSHVFFWKNWFK